MIEHTYAIGRKRNFDHRSQVFKLLNDIICYEMDYSTDSEPVVRKGDTVEFSKCSLGFDDHWTGHERNQLSTVGVPAISVCIISRAGWRVDGLVQAFFD